MRPNKPWMWYTERKTDRQPREMAAMSNGLPYACYIIRMYR
jgi:hypothetical protein